MDVTGGTKHVNLVNEIPGIFFILYDVPHFTLYLD